MDAPARRGDGRAGGLSRRAAPPGVIRSRVMRAHCRLAALLALLLLPAIALAQGQVEADSGRFVIFQDDVPMARERFAFQRMGDSLVITAFNQRTLQDEQGVKHPFQKALALVVDSRDLGLRSYTSIEQFQGHTMTRGLVPGDTSISYYSEYDGMGTATRLVQPPGRLYVMDSHLFTLFEVISRSLAARTFTSRPVQILALADSMRTPVATVTAEPADTLRLGTRRVPARRFTFADESASFALWTDASGRLLRLTHESGLRVEREPDTAPPPRKRARGR